MEVLVRRALFRMTAPALVRSVVYPPAVRPE